MANKSYLVFSVMERVYAVDLMIVREMIDLPELTPVEEMPHFITGVFKLRGNIIPVMDLNVIFGHSGNRYSITDSLIVTEHEGITAGIIANELHDVVDIPDEEIQALPAVDQGSDHKKRYILGEARVEENIVMVIDCDNMLGMNYIVDDQQQKQSSELRYFCPEAGPDERQVFRERANGYGRPAEPAESGCRVPVAVIGLNGEFFGMEIDPVREFADIRGVVPVPNSPAHIIGVMNLRGDITVLFDIRGILRMPVTAPGNLRHAVISERDDDMIGIAVEEILDLVYLDPGDIAKAPGAGRRERQEYI